MTDKKSRLIGMMSEQVSSSDIVAAEQLAKISAVIAKKRIEMSMSQTEFAGFMGVSQGMVSKWESEDYNFTVEALARICDKLDMELTISLTPKKKHQHAKWLRTE